MDALHYTPVFDVLAPGYRPWLMPTLVGAAVVFIALVFLLFFKRRISGASAPTFQILVACVPLLVLPAIMIPAITAWGFARACSTLRSGSALYVEGTVSHFKPMPPRPKGTESFLVKDIPFDYSDNEVTAGFHQTVRSGGPMHEGLPVHIWYMKLGPGGNEILKLEVAEK